jgi:hypothetical protein
MSANVVKELAKIYELTDQRAIGTNVLQPVILQHKMISYDWDHKKPVRRMNTALQKFGYRT